MLEYVALGITFFVAIVFFYGIIAIHDIPYEIAKHRNHPHLDAIHVAGWVSLFTLHVIWPFLWIWATLYREDRGWGFAEGKQVLDSVVQLEARIDKLTERLNIVENRAAQPEEKLEDEVAENETRKEESE